MTDIKSEENAPEINDLTYAQAIEKVEVSFRNVLGIVEPGPDELFCRSLAAAAVDSLTSRILTDNIKTGDAIHSLAAIAELIQKITQYGAADWRADVRYLTANSFTCHGINLLTSIQPRPHYCDRGRFDALVDFQPRKHRKINWMGISRHYFDWQICVRETEMWMDGIGEFCNRDRDPDAPRKFPYPTDLKHEDEYHQCQHPALSKYPLSVPSTRVRPWMLERHTRHYQIWIMPLFERPASTVVWRWVWDAKMFDEDQLDLSEHFSTIDENDRFPRFFVTLDNLLDECEEFLRFRKEPDE